MNGGYTVIRSCIARHSARKLQPYPFQTVIPAIQETLWPWIFRPADQHAIGYPESIRFSYKSAPASDMPEMQHAC